ncbi:MAG: hypothetical protein KBS41_03790, partial [Oscillospiraceae bacterium]|nr:hypothetical protein [Candidatus Equicaccousia limihippi]
LQGDKMDICIKGENTKLILCAKEGYISSLTYKNKEYIGAVVPLFVIGLRDREGNLTKTTAFDMELVSHSADESGFVCKYANGQTIVTATANYDGKYYFKIAVEGIKNQAIEWVNYPQIAVHDDLADKGGNSKILWGYNEGTLIEDLTVRETVLGYYEPEYPCQGMMGVYPAVVETQFMAYYNDISGLYFAAHDKDDNLKGINFVGENGGIKLEFRHFTGSDFGAAYKMEYSMVADFFEGDWYDAAEIYRGWFESLNKPEFVQIEQNPKLPQWYGDSPVVITYPVRGKHDTDVMNPNKLFPYINVMPHVEKFEKAFGSKVMILLMHWEGTAPWAPPIVWPPFGGEEELKKLIDALHERGDLAGVYCSGLGWTIDSHLTDYNTKNQFEQQNLADEMCLSPKQTLPFSAICNGQREGYDMCPSREFTVNTLKEQVENMVGAGLDYVQLMDQNHGGTSYFCYSHKHGHPPVPGKWQVDAVKKMLETVQTNAGQTLFGCESAAAQSYIPYLLFSDNRFNIAYYIGKPVPIYAYIYHQYVNNFLGNQVCVDWHIDAGKFKDSFFERIAYSFAAGDMLTVVINEDGQIDWNWGKKDKERPVPNQEHAAMFIKNLNMWRTGKGKKYLHTGKMIKPMAVKCENYQMERNTLGTITVPRIHTSAWLSKDGGKAQFLVNYGETAYECTVDTENEVYFADDGTAARKLSVGINKISVPPFSAVMLERE